MGKTDCPLGIAISVHCEHMVQMVSNRDASLLIRSAHGGRVKMAYEEDTEFVSPHN